jgi:hypothetical protein
MAPLTKSLTPRLETRLLLPLCCCGDVARSPFAPGTLAARMAKFTGPAVLYTNVSKGNVSEDEQTYEGLTEEKLVSRCKPLTVG